MSQKRPLNIHRPYLVIPKLVVQPTWGGSYIVETKGWSDRPGHDAKIGQSYELFSGINLSLLSSSKDPMFEGELADRDSAQIPTSPPNSIALSELTAIDPAAVLGASVVENRGPEIALLIKFTQALGNSFQTHIRDGETHPKWKPKPESWYYFEPGLLTFGVKADANWSEYEHAVRQVHDAITNLSEQVKSGVLSFDDAQEKVTEILQQYDPWQFVNTVAIKKDQIVDLSEGGIHHSWEEDSEKAPLGNVLLELQGEAMDDVSTFRSFDKGKMEQDGSIRDVHIDNYFDVIDRSPETNDPTTHIRDIEKVLSETDDYRLEQLMRSRLYDMDKLTLLNGDASYEEEMNRYKHIFVKSGSIKVIAGEGEVVLGAGHSCFIPAATQKYRVENLTDRSEILISF